MHQKVCKIVFFFPLKIIIILLINRVFPIHFEIKKNNIFFFTIFKKIFDTFHFQTKYSRQQHLPELQFTAYQNFLGGGTTRTETTLSHLIYLLGGNSAHPSQKYLRLSEFRVRCKGLAHVIILYHFYFMVPPGFLGFYGLALGS